MDREDREDRVWQRTIQDVAPSVVSVIFQRPFPSDTDAAKCSEATGFIVDDERGLILTNHHVTGMTPFVGRIILHNHRECNVGVAYTDPVHDFAFLCFDPKQLKTSSKALKLRPDLAKEGLPIRVLGNDSGEKFTILQAVISRTDLNAPEYPQYMDFNTHYIQAAASGKGGTSGSPAIDERGNVVAMVGGCRAFASTNYLLPLDRVLRALRLLRKDQPIPRGTLQVRFELNSLDNCRKSGLPPTYEDIIPDDSLHMLVARTVLPDGPAASKINVGDILVEVNGQIVTSFTVLESIWDDAVGKKIRMKLIRSGEEVNIELDVGNLYDITPRKILMVGEASLQDVSYQIAQRFSLSLKAPGVLISGAKGQFEFAKGDSAEGIFSWVAIRRLDDKPTPNLAVLMEAIRDIPDRKRVVVQYQYLNKAQCGVDTIIWSNNMRSLEQKDVNGDWDYPVYIKGMPAQPPVPQRSTFTSLSSKFVEAEKAARSFVRVTCDVQDSLDSFSSGKVDSHGVVLDSTLGFVLVAKSYIPHKACMVSLTFAESIDIDAEIAFIHPFHNYTVLRYDSTLVEAPVWTPEFSNESIRKGDTTIFCGLNQNSRPFIQETSISDIISACIPKPAAPTYSGFNFDAIILSPGNILASNCGLLLDTKGKIKAFWLTYPGGEEKEYKAGLAASIVTPLISRLQNGDIPELRILNVEFQRITMGECRHMGVSDAFIDRIQRENHDRHQLFIVQRVDPGFQSGLEENDILLTMNGNTATEAPALDLTYSGECLGATVMRNGREVSITVRTAPANDYETTHYMRLGGATLQRPHQAACLRARKIPSRVFVSGAPVGSTAQSYRLQSPAFVTNINGTYTPDLGTVLEVVAKISEGAWLSITQVSLNGEYSVVRMRHDTKYFKTEDRKLTPSGWRETIINSTT